jgi:hypothetical protein
MHHYISLKINQSLKDVSIFYAQCTERFVKICGTELLDSEVQHETSKSILAQYMNVNREEKDLDLWVSNQIVQISYTNSDSNSKYL